SAVRSRSDVTCAAVSDGFTPQTSAAAPATCGAAYDVPVPYPYVPIASPATPTRPYVEAGAVEDRAPSTRTPGARSDTYEPELEKGARFPVSVDAPTAIPFEPKRAAG